MYCRNCGKQIECGELCNECAQSPEANNNSQYQQQYGYQQQQYGYQQQYAYQQNNYGNSYYQNTLPDPQNRMYGFGKALTGTILGAFGCIWVYLLFSIAIEELEYGYYDAELILGCWILSFFALPFIVISLVFGIMSITTFVSRSKANCVKPIATLILGIGGVSFASNTLIIAFFLFLSTASTLFV